MVTATGRNLRKSPAALIKGPFLISFQVVQVEPRPHEGLGPPEGAILAQPQVQVSWGEGLPGEQRAEVGGVGYSIHSVTPRHPFVHHGPGKDALHVGTGAQDPKPQTATSQWMFSVTLDPGLSPIRLPRGAVSPVSLEVSVS